GAVGLVVASFVETSMGVEKFWPVAFQLMALVPILSVILMFLFVAEPKREGVAEAAPAGISARRVADIWIKPVMSFVGNYGVRIGIILLMLIFLFKVGEAFLGRMSIIFYKEVGFSKNDIALYSKGFGTLALCAFAVIGSIINARYGLYRGLLIGGIAMASTNLLFAALAYHPAEWLFAFAVVTDQFTTAMSTVALVAFLSQLCDRAYAATQYAAFASIGNFSRTTLAVFSGVMVDSLGGNWALFFVLTTLMVLPSLALLVYIRKDIAALMEGKTTKVI
ncbi:MAG: MFS transporter, partial [Betaproteobacteria bacterium AqS2]|nr:MFS transporter [Betaproteobacteria bacterium AqS2]